MGGSAMAQARGGTSRGPRGANFIIIFMDDQGYQDVGCFGSPNIKTPNLDRMAAEGMKFTDFYSAASVCSPSRAALLTGCYPPRVGITKVLFPRDNIGLNPNEVTIADVMKKQGYATACIGKWHLGHLPEFLPTSNGFDYYFGIPYSNDMDGVKGKDRNLDRTWREKDWTPWNVPLMRNKEEIERPADQTKIIERYTEEAAGLIRKNANKPFFLYLPHTMPHVPLFVSDEFYTEDVKKAYKATIEQIDWSVGEVLKAVKEIGADERTLVVFTSDNGPWLNKKHHAGSALPLRDGKFSTYEGGMREPCIMRWPGKIPAGRVCSEVCGTIDLLPTLALRAGARPPSDRVIDGKDIWPLMTGEAGAKSPHKAYYYYRGTTLEAVREGRWKLRIVKKKTELYDLKTDISEKWDYAKKYPQIVKRMTDMMKEFDSSLKASSRPVGKVER
jgi:arylsulfatase A-like enzyme